MAVAYGLPEAAVLKAVTLAPAEILGVADQLGSLEVGKRANLVLTLGHILQPTTEVKGLFIGGKPLNAREPPHPALLEVQGPAGRGQGRDRPVLALYLPRSSSTPTSPSTTPVSAGQGDRKVTCPKTMEFPRLGHLQCGDGRVFLF